MLNKCPISVFSLYGIAVSELKTLVSRDLLVSFLNSPFSKEDLEYLGTIVDSKSQSKLNISVHYDHDNSNKGKVGILGLVALDFDLSQSITLIKAYSYCLRSQNIDFRLNYDFASNKFRFWLDLLDENICKKRHCVLGSNLVKEYDEYNQVSYEDAESIITPLNPDFSFCSQEELFGSIDTIQRGLDGANFPLVYLDTNKQITGIEPLFKYLCGVVIRENASFQKEVLKNNLYHLQHKFLENASISEKDQNQKKIQRCLEWLDEDEIQNVG